MKRRVFFQLASVASLSACTINRRFNSDSVIAQTQFGRVKGYRNNGVNAFKGIPYGADTAGENRFLPPKDPLPWAGVREALSYGPAAPQSDPAAAKQYDGRESENCLVLNVWSKGLNDGAKRPVMVWLHGGGFRSLSASSPGYDGTNLCLRGDVVVVGLNHRLNVLGFLHLADSGEGPFAQSGNVGMLDIVHALTWVKNNIAQFGGDPNRVMIFGESGGGRKVATLLAMPAAKGLFHRAVIQSGATLRVADRYEAAENTEKFLANLGVKHFDLHQLQKLPIKNIMAAYFKYRNTETAQLFQPVIDQDILPHHPFSPAAAPVHADVPLIVGANRTEMTYFADEKAFNLDRAGMLRRVGALVGQENRDEVINVYLSDNPGISDSELYFLIASDFRYVMAAITIADRRAVLNPETYSYYLTWESPARDGMLMTPHSLDIPFVFDNTRINPLTRGSNAADILAAEVSSRWIEFARTGNPNSSSRRADGLPVWTKYTVAKRSTMVINNDSQIVSDPLSARRELMTSILSL